MSVPKYGDDVYQLVETEFERRHPKSSFIPGETPVPVTERCLMFRKFTLQFKQV